MIFRKALITLAFSFLSLCEISCIRELGITFPSINKGKRNKKIAPTFDFNHALFSYRQKNGYWPKSEYDFSSGNPYEIKGIYNAGFESWSLGYSSDDTLYMYFIHEPIADGAHVGIIPIPDKKIYVKSRYVFSNRVITTKIIKRKQYYRQ